MHYREEGTRAIHEAIRLALHDNNTKLLQHCLVCYHTHHMLCVKPHDATLP